MLVFVESYATVSAEYQTDWVEGDFAVSVWMLPRADCDGFILTKLSATDSSLTYYSLKVSTDSNGDPLSLLLSVLDKETQVSCLCY